MKKLLSLILLTACGSDNTPLIYQGQTGAQGAVGAQGSMGINGLSTLVNQKPAASSVCINGGTILMIGLDTNNNGILDPSEITQTAVICNGQNGASGLAGVDGTNNTNGGGSNGGIVTFNLVQAIEPCGSQSSPWKETLLGLQGGQLLSDFSETSSGQNTRLSFIPNGTYVDTDSSGCVFTVSGDGITNSHISWNAGSNNYSSWVAGGYDWSNNTGWAAH